MEKVVLTGFTLSEFLEKIEQVIDLKIGQLTPIKKHVESVYISRKEAAEILNVSLPTIHEWTRQRLLKSYKIASGVYYKRSEVEEAISMAATYKKKGGLE